MPLLKSFLFKEEVRLSRGVEHHSPDGLNELKKLLDLATAKTPFTFVRFSDGEVEILRNHRLSISEDKTEYRGRTFDSNFPIFDHKEFMPESGQSLRRDLLSAAIFSSPFYFKGIPTWHNNMVEDREFLLRLNGGVDQNMTFSDLFMNSNYEKSRVSFFPILLKQFEKVFIVGNWRIQPQNILKAATKITIPDSFFSEYIAVSRDVYKQLLCIPKGSLVLSSASSLSNILGCWLRRERPDLTFIDVGTSLNDLLGMPSHTRDYHSIYKPKTLKQKILAARFKSRKGYNLKW